MIMAKGYVIYNPLAGNGNAEEDAKLLADMLKEKYGTKKVFYYYIGAVIGAHTGPGVMAVFFLGNQR